TGDILTPNVNLNDYMEYNNSDLLSLNVTANTNIIEGSSYTESGSDSDWIVNDTLYNTGNLTWDNGTGIEGCYVNITVKYLNGTTIAYNDSVFVGEFGSFNGSLVVDASWPNEQSETIIEVEFNPYDSNNFGKPEGYYIEESNSSS
ncbi:MAG: hypothetical protein ACOC44_15635, partial [Promethearchaeia archaeon]